MVQEIVLLVHDLVDHQRYAYVTDRLPVTIGRDRELAACRLEGDVQVSGVHASVDLRENQLLVRAEKSIDGTLVDGLLLPADDWVTIGSADHLHEIRIRGWAIAVVAATEAIMEQVEAKYELRGRASVISKYDRGSAPSTDMSEFAERLRELEEKSESPWRRFDN